MSHKDWCTVCGVISLMCNFPDSGHPSATWLLKQVGKQMSANKKNCYWPNWLETFQKWKAEAMTRKPWEKKAKAWEKLLTKFSSQSLTLSNAGTSVSFKDAGGSWNSSRKRSMIYIVVNSGQPHKKWKVNWKMKKNEESEKCATSQSFPSLIGISQVLWECHESLFVSQ